MPIAERSGGKIKILFFIMIEISKTKQTAQTGNSMISAVGAETTLNTRADRIAYGRGNQSVFNAMRNLTKIFILLTTFIVFITCSKDEIRGNSSIIESKGAIGVDDDIAEVKAMIITGESEDGRSWIGYECGSSTFKNNGFKIKLCSTVPNQYLDNWDTDFFDEDFATSSDRSAKMAVIGVIAYDSKGKEVGEFECYDEPNDCYAFYVYADRKFTVKGEGTGYSCDCSFKKGWNVLYYEDRPKEDVITTKKPSGVTLRWHYE